MQGKENFLFITYEELQEVIKPHTCWPSSPHSSPPHGSHFPSSKACSATDPGAGATAVNRTGFLSPEWERDHGQINQIDGSWEEELRRKGQRERRIRNVSKHTIFSRVVGGGLQEKITLKRRTEGEEGDMEISWESVPGRGPASAKALG